MCENREMNTTGLTWHEECEHGSYQDNQSYGLSRTIMDYWNQITPVPYFRMSLFENKTNDGDLGKLHADHNMNSPGDGKQHFPFASFPPFPFLPRIPVTHGDSMPTPLSLNLTGQIAGDSPRSAGSEDSPKSSPTGWWNFYSLLQPQFRTSRGCWHSTKEFLYTIH